VDDGTVVRRGTRQTTKWIRKKKKNKGAKGKEKREMTLSGCLDL
jgi:hypothetical protein